MIRKILLPVIIVSSLPCIKADDAILLSFDSKKAFLPSVQYSGEQYDALVWVYNEGKRYEDGFYNNIWATPPTDSEGRQWFEADFTPEDDSQWSMKTAPFSSDEYYKGFRSFQWIKAEYTGEIYMRRSFVTEKPIVGRLFLACGHDDAPAEFYINGVMVHSISDGWNNDEYVLLTEEQQALIRTDGTENILAVHVHQNWGGAYADCGLYYADARKVHSFLNIIDEGPWQCKEYILNYNTDLKTAEAKKWASLDEDESDWMDALGPFSNDDNMFFTSFWPSRLRPILLRRHFTLTKADIEYIADNPLTLRCSYDEYPKIYLNGTLIWSAERWNDNNYAEIRLSAAYKAFLREGDNVLAVSLQAGEGGGHIDYGLRIELPYEYDALESIVADHNPFEADNRIFNLSGVFIGTDPSRLPAGIYISGGKKFIKK